MSHHILYTFGYGVRHTTAVLALLPGLIMDVRLSPRSRIPGWNKFELERALGDRYMHVEELGNVLFKTNGVRLKDDAKGFEILLAELERGPVTILCGCGDVRGCHRLVIANRAANRYGVKVEHLFQDL